MLPYRMLTAVVQGMLLGIVPVRAADAVRVTTLLETAGSGRVHFELGRAGRFAAHRHPGTANLPTQGPLDEAGVRAK